MSLTELSVKRGVTVSMMFLILVGFGLFSLARLRLDMYPDITFPMIGVVTQYEGAGPREIEDLVSRPIEGAVAAVEGVTEVSSTSKQGVSIVNVEFDWGTDLDQAETDVRKFIDFIEGMLPDEVDAPMVFAFDPSMQPILFMALSGPYDQVKLREIAEERIEPMLERLPGVASVDTMGGGEREIQVRLDPRRLGAAGIAPQQVVQALNMDNVQLPGGSFDQGGWEFNIQTKGRFTEVRQIENVVVGVRKQVPIRLRDVATVVDGLQERTRIVRNNGRPGIMLAVRKQSDANTVQAVRAVMASLPDVQAQAGRGIELSAVFNQGDFIEKSIGNLSSTAVVAFLIAFIVLLFFLRNLRSSIIVATAIPISVISTFFIMYAWPWGSITLNIISMAGLALAIGMLVDNSIVVLESIFAHSERGMGGRQAALTGAGEVATAITASTLTTMAVFVPILFVQGIAGEMFGDMAITICFSLAASLLVARVGIPMAASRLLESRRRGGRGLLRGLSALVQRFMDLLQRIYTPSLAWCLRNRKKTLLLTTIVFVASMGLGASLDQEFFPRNDQGIFGMQIEAAVGSSIEETDRYFRRLEKIVEEHVPERTVYNADIGTGEGFVAMFAKGPHAGILRLKLRDQDERARSQQEIENDLRERFSAVPGITATVMQPNLMGSGADIVVEIYGHDLVTARRVGSEIKEIARSLPGTADVTFSMEAGKPEYEVVLDRKRLAALGLNTATVSSAISTVFAGSLAIPYREGGNEYDIRVRGPRGMRRDARDLEGLSVVTPTGAKVPLTSIATVRPAVGPAEIQRQDQQRMVSVNITVPGRNLGAVLEALKTKLAQHPWPDGFVHQIGGQAEDFQESFESLGLAFLAAVLLVYMVMASQFESLLHPFLILFTIPLALVGVVLGLALTGTPISVVALIGVLVLAGVVVNNAIVLIDTINQSRERDLSQPGTAGGEDHATVRHPDDRELSVVDPVLAAGRRRLRPILMTALTTMLGMLPLALEIGEGAESWSPMARAVIGGLATSTFLTLIVIPTLYTSVETFRVKRRLRRQARLDGGANVA